MSGQHGVPDSHLTSSSSWNSHLPNDNNGPERGRLFTQAYDYGNGTFYRGAWSAAVNDKNQYIQVGYCLCLHSNVHVNLYVWMLKGLSFFFKTVVNIYLLKVPVKPCRDNILSIM